MLSTVRAVVKKSKSTALVSVVLLSLTLVACRSGTAASVGEMPESQVATSAAVSYLKEQGFLYDENEHDIFVSEGKSNGQAVWLISILPKNHSVVKSRETVTATIDGKEVQLEKVTPNSLVHGPRVRVSKSDGSIVDVEFGQ